MVLANGIPLRMCRARGLFDRNDCSTLWFCRGKVMVVVSKLRRLGATELWLCCSTQVLAVKGRMD